MSSLKQINSLKTLAGLILFGKIKNDDFYGWQFRKGKTTDDINNAVRKALNPKNGFGKTEYELSMLETYLNDVLKRDRKIKC